MREIEDRFRDLGQVVPGAPPSPADVRGAADRRARHRQALAGAAAVACFAAVTAAAAAMRPGRDVLDPAVPSPTAAAPAPSAAPTPWLDAPWELESADDSELGPGAVYRFCGTTTPVTLARGAPVRVSEQVLTHPDGLRAELVAYAPPRADDAMQVFKLTYAQCLVPGGARGVPGPRNVWLYAGTAGASEVAGTALRVAQVTGSGRRTATTDDAQAVLDGWRR